MDEEKLEAPLPTEAFFGFIRPRNLPLEIKKRVVVSNLKMLCLFRARICRLNSLAMSAMLLNILHLTRSVGLDSSGVSKSVLPEA